MSVCLLVSSQYVSRLSGSVSQSVRQPIREFITQSVSQAVYKQDSSTYVITIVAATLACVAPMLNGDQATFLLDDSLLANKQSRTVRYCVVCLYQHYDGTC